MIAEPNADEMRHTTALRQAWWGSDDSLSALDEKQRCALLRKLQANVSAPTPEGCIEWKGGRVSTGLRYGRVFFGDKSYLAHRAMYALSIRDPQCYLVLHHCDNPICINVEHLYHGTYRDNSDDKISRNRQKFAGKGEAHNQHRLTDDDVREMRRLRQQGMKLKNISSQFGVAIPHVSRIVNGIYWSHVK